MVVELVSVDAAVKPFSLPKSKMVLFGPAEDLTVINLPLRLISLLPVPE